MHLLNSDGTKAGDEIFKTSNLIQGSDGQVGGDNFAGQGILLEHYEDLSNGDKFFLLLEKDFACLDNTHEDQSDKYPNPKAGKC